MQQRSAARLLRRRCAPASFEMHVAQRVLLVLQCYVKLPHRAATQLAHLHRRVGASQRGGDRRVEGVALDDVASLQRLLAHHCLQFAPFPHKRCH